MTSNNIAAFHVTGSSHTDVYQITEESELGVKYLMTVPNHSDYVVLHNDSLIANELVFNLQNKSFHMIPKFRYKSCLAIDNFGLILGHQTCAMVQLYQYEPSDSKYHAVGMLCDIKPSGCSHQDGGVRLMKRQIPAFEGTIVTFFCLCGKLLQKVAYDLTEKKTTYEHIYQLKNQYIKDFDFVPGCEPLLAILVGFKFLIIDHELQVIHRIYNGMNENSLNYLILAPQFDIERNPFVLTQIQGMLYSQYIKDNGETRIRIPGAENIESFWKDKEIIGLIQFGDSKILLVLDKSGNVTSVKIGTVGSDKLQ
ncbi:hypothetical protein FGO68_gene16170 [Halteria grandinella]|uniref:Uncharacterized protein n=1 Tax=Halteria grandinella TaxID=5974 RepID=A0A8J8P867_HALGN|nr:hypothetical protein FGO68_gene16170 [Halteria grandinella]